jgi:hypothetical protein
VNIWERWEKEGEILCSAIVALRFISILERKVEKVELSVELDLTDFDL